MDLPSTDFDGWLLWTWDGDEQTGFYNGLGMRLIYQVLAVCSRADPCEPGRFSFFEDNLALAGTGEFHARFKGIILQLYQWRHFRLVREDLPRSGSRSTLANRPRSA